jgi:uncharacterized protein YjiS (DUF1127 family)
MLDILARSIARAGGIEVPDNVRIVEAAASRRPILEVLADAFGRWNVRRATWLTLRELDDRTLTDIGLDRGMLRDVADDMSRVAVNDNELPVALSHLAANDNIDSVRAG